jgi:hypothetical protein
MCGAGRLAVYAPPQVSARGTTMCAQCGLRHVNRLPNGLGMASDPADDFHIRVGRSRSRGAGADARIRPFVKQVEVAIRKAGGNPNRIGRSAGNPCQWSGGMTMTIIALGVLAIGSPFVTFLAVWWSANWERMRMAEAMPASDDAKDGGA